MRSESGKEASRSVFFLFFAKRKIYYLLSNIYYLLSQLKLAPVNLKGSVFRLTGFVLLFYACDELWCFEVGLVLFFFFLCFFYVLSVSISVVLFTFQSRATRVGVTFVECHKSNQKDVF